MGLRGTEEIIISPWQELKLTSHKIYLQISLCWKVNLLSREEKKEVRNNLKMTVLNIKKPYDSFNFTIFKRTLLQQ